MEDEDEDRAVEIGVERMFPRPAVEMEKKICECDGYERFTDVMWSKRRKVLTGKHEHAHERHRS